MANRRQIIQSGLAASALPALSLADAALAAHPEHAQVYRAIYDERFAEGQAFALQAAQRGWPTRAIRGDVTDLWFHELGPRWKQGPAAVCGLTARESLFCLEHLAWDARMRVVSRTVDPKTQLVSWLIAPVRRV